MSDLNIIIADNDQLSEIYTSLKNRKNMLQAYNQLYIDSRDLYFNSEQQELAKEAEEAMKEIDNHIEIVDTLLNSIA